MSKLLLLRMLLLLRSELPSAPSFAPAPRCPLLTCPAAACGVVSEDVVLLRNSRSGWGWPLLLPAAPEDSRLMSPPPPSSLCNEDDDEVARGRWDDRDDTFEAFADLLWPPAPSSSWSSPSATLRSS
jgi:hypothetical protein